MLFVLRVVFEQDVGEIDTVRAGDNGGFAGGAVLVVEPPGGYPAAIFNGISVHYVPGILLRNSWDAVEWLCGRADGCEVAGLFLGQVSFNPDAAELLQSRGYLIAAEQLAAVLDEICQLADQVFGQGGIIRQDNQFEVLEYVGGHFLVADYVVSETGLVQETRHQVGEIFNIFCFGRESVSCGIVAKNSYFCVGAEKPQIGEVKTGILIFSAPGGNA